MKLAIIGAGGVGGYFGAKLLRAGHNVSFVARGEHLHALQTKGLHVKHPSLEFGERVDAFDMSTLMKRSPSSFDALILLTKSMQTALIAEQLLAWFNATSLSTYVISLQNGVENEAILSNFLPKEYIIGGLTRKIGAHVIKPAYIEAVGTAETILGMMHSSMENERFVEELALIFNQAEIPTQTTHNIKQELWKKLIINNGVNALCALLRVQTGVLFEQNSLADVVYGLMQETAHAARSLHIKISQEDVDAMFTLIKQFDSIKPSMLVDLEHGRSLEIEEICGVVIRALHQIGVDAPYTKTIKALLEFKLGEKV
mgnify:CR=1 FL=1